MELKLSTEISSLHSTMGNQLNNLHEQGKKNNNNDPMANKQFPPDQMDYPDDDGIYIYIYICMYVCV